MKGIASLLLSFSFSLSHPYFFSCLSNSCFLQTHPSPPGASSQAHLYGSQFWLWRGTAGHYEGRPLLLWCAGGLNVLIHSPITVVWTWLSEQRTYCLYTCRQLHTITSRALLVKEQWHQRARNNAIKRTNMPDFLSAAWTMAREDVLMDKSDIL